MNIEEFAGIALVGALLTAVIAVIKKVFGVEGLATKLLTIVLALVVGGAYVWLRSTPYFQTAILVLTTSSTVYALFVK